MYVPVIIAVRWVASIPWVTSSAVEAEPNPLGPLLPVISEYNPIFSSLASLFSEICLSGTNMEERDREKLRRKRGVRE